MRCWRVAAQDAPKLFVISAEEEIPLLSIVNNIVCRWMAMVADASVMSGDGGNNSRMRSVLKGYLFLSRHLKKLTNSYDIEYRDYESAQAITHFDRHRYALIQEFQTRASLIII